MTLRFVTHDYEALKAMEDCKVDLVYRAKVWRVLLPLLATFWLGLLSILFPQTTSLTFGTLFMVACVAAVIIGCWSH